MLTSLQNIDQEVNESKNLKQKVQILTDQINQFEAIKRFELQKYSKEKNILQDQINILTNEIQIYSKTNDKLKSQILELSSD